MLGACRRVGPGSLPWQVLRAREAPDAAFEVFIKTPGVAPTDLRVRVFPPDRLLVEVRGRRRTV